MNFWAKTKVAASPFHDWRYIHKDPSRRQPSWLIWFIWNNSSLVFHLVSINQSLIDVICMIFSHSESSFGKTMRPPMSWSSYWNRVRFIVLFIFTVELNIHILLGNIDCKKDLYRGGLSAQADYPDIIQAAENTCAHLLFNRMPGSELNRYTWLLNNNLFKCASISINHVTSERTWGVLAKLSLCHRGLGKLSSKYQQAFVCL